MRIFLPGIPQDVYHFTDYAQTGQEYQGRFDIAHPGSLLYAKNPDGGYTLVGAMYSAPPDALPQDLDAIVPLSIARWHVHTNICLPNDLTIDDLLRNDVGADRAEFAGHAAGVGRAECGRIESSLRLSRRWTFRLRGKNLRRADNAPRLAAIWSSRHSDGWSTSILSRAMI